MKRGKDQTEERGQERKSVEKDNEEEKAGANTMTPREEARIKNQGQILLVFLEITLQSLPQSFILHYFASKIIRRTKISPSPSTHLSLERTLFTRSSE